MKLNLTTKEILTLLDGLGWIAFGDSYTAGIYDDKTITQEEFEALEKQAVDKLKKAIQYKGKGR